MKKLFLLSGLIFLSALSGQAEKLRIIPRAGFYIPVSKVYTPNISISAMGLYRWQDNYYFQGSINFMPLSLSSTRDQEWHNFSGSIIALIGGARKYAPAGNLYYEAGGGIYIWRRSFDTYLGSEQFILNDHWNEHTIGGYAGIGYEAEINGNKIDINGSIHLPDFNEFFISLNIGYIFDLPIK